MLLIGEKKTGFHIYEERLNESPRAIATCRVTQVNTAASEDQFCFTMRIAKLNANTKIFVKDLETNTGVHYLKTSTYFGLIRI